MLLTLTATAEPGTAFADARDLGFIVHKHPDRVQEFTLSVGRAHVFYPQADPERASISLLLEIDPVELARGKRFGGDRYALGQYVNDRPYAASSMLAVALGRVFSTARAGVSKTRPDLPGQPLSLMVQIPAMPCRGDDDLVSRLFAPLGWDVQASPIPLDPRFPQWGDSRYVNLRLSGTHTVQEALSHLYILLPVLDGAKHYWVSDDEIDKLIRRGGAWLAGHPEQGLITRRYLAHRRNWVEDALARLAELEGDAESDQLTQAEVEEALVPEDERQEAVAPVVPLVRLRHAAVLRALQEVEAARVVDLGCGPGALVQELLKDSRFTHILGTDVSARELERASARLRLDRMPPRARQRITLVQSSLTYQDARIAGFDAAVLMEVIEHIDPDRLESAVRTVFGHARPGAVIVTTPNAEYNVRYESLPAGQFRHPDHRFEWTRDQFQQWALRVAGSHGYEVEFRPVGEDDPQVGPPTQLALFRHVTQVRRQVVTTDA